MVSCQLKNHCRTIIGATFGQLWDLFLIENKFGDVVFSAFWICANMIFKAFVVMLFFSIEVLEYFLYYSF